MPCLRALIVADSGEVNTSYIRSNTAHISEGLIQSGGTHTVQLQTHYRETLTSGYKTETGT